MSEQTQTIARLDRSKPPPGYEIRDTSYEDGDSEVGGYGVIIEEWSWLADGYTDSAASREICIADAWLHFEEDNDPPGLVVWCDPFSGGDVWWFGDEDKAYSPEHHQTESEARAAAWAAYWRRVAVSLAMEASGIEAYKSVWPGCLAWPDNTVAHHESAMRLIGASEVLR